MQLNDLRLLTEPFENNWSLTCEWPLHLWSSTIPFSFQWEQQQKTRKCVHVRCSYCTGSIKMNDFINTSSVGRGGPTICAKSPFFWSLFNFLWTGLVHGLLCFCFSAMRLSITDNNRPAWWVGEGGGGRECRWQGGKRAIWISGATLQAFNNRINVAPGDTVPLGRGSMVEKRRKRIKRIID